MEHDHRMAGAPGPRTSREAAEHETRAPWHARIQALASNLWWSWDAEATALWRRVDPFRWEAYHHNPVALLHDVEQARWGELVADESFMDTLEAVWKRFEAYLEGPGWAAAAAPELYENGGIAYFSMEFGLHESLRLYSGGLGVLAGDHVRSASDLGVPLVGISLLYREGYFRQLIEEGRQLAAYPQADWSRLPIHPCVDEDGLHIEVPVPMEDRVVKARVWELYVGRCRILLLDTDHDGNDWEDRAITRQLYGGDDLNRIRQEVVLGLGGVRALREFHLDPAVFHLNEGHCAFVPLALAAERVHHDPALGWQGALEQVRERIVFTTHTPVPAGHDRFSWDLVNRVLGHWRDSLGLPRGTFMDLGRVRPGDWAETLSMTVLALRCSAATNGVSALHGHVSRRMFNELWPDLEVPEVPVGHVTNGVHPVYWMAPEARALFDRALPEWRERPWDAQVWKGIADISDEELWALRGALRRRLVDHVAASTGRRFDPDALTIGFARRFAPYKRGNLLFRDLDRLRAILERGNVQVVFSGKAHPRDGWGQDILSDVVRRSERLDLRDRVVLLPDYDMALGALLTSGSDVWLNNPRRPHEASGTSGQKVCLNGGLNLSVLDGWWPEGFDGTNGWALGDGREWSDEQSQDAFDAQDLYATLEDEVLPEWLDRDERGIPRRWVARMRRSIETCVPLFSSHRMVRDYALELYVPRTR